MFYITHALALVVCGCSQRAACTHPCSPWEGSPAVLLLLTVQACFVFVGKVYAASHLCYLRDRRWVSAFVLFWLCELPLLYYLLWGEGKELSCSEEVRQRLLLGELLKLSWLLFVKNKNFESFSGILGDPQCFNWINIMLFLMSYCFFLLFAFATCFTCVTMVNLVVSELP